MVEIHGLKPKFCVLKFCKKRVFCSYLKIPRTPRSARHTKMIPNTQGTVIGVEHVLYQSTSFGILKSVETRVESHEKFDFS